MGDRKKILICGPNWLGDCVMSMPAIRRFKRRNSGVRLEVMTKAPWADLWRMNPDVDGLQIFASTVPGTMRAAMALRKSGYDRACVLPNSFRSAFIPCLAGIPERIGFRGRLRQAMLTRVVVPPTAAALRHQMWEAMAILGAPHDGADDLEPPYLNVEPGERAECGSQFSVSPAERWIAFFPGAARGLSKRWPAEHFITVGRALMQSDSCRILVLGSVAEQSLCAVVADGIGAGARNLAGQTSLRQLAALLALCRVCVANDCGGMHLAAAVNTPVVAVYGITDPEKTGPLGRAHRVVAQPGLPRRRDIRPLSATARRALHAVHPEQVCTAARRALKGAES